MNRDDVIRMAQECGLTINYTNFPQVLHFADRVAAAEREACARVCEEKREEWGWDNDGEIAIRDCANAIRGRGEG